MSNYLLNDNIEWIGKEVNPDGMFKIYSKQANFNT